MCGEGDHDRPPGVFKIHYAPGGWSSPPRSPGVDHFSHYDPHLTEVNVGVNICYLYGGSLSLSCRVFHPCLPALHGHYFGPSNNTRALSRQCTFIGEEEGEEEGAGGSDL